MRIALVLCLLSLVPACSDNTKVFGDAYIRDGGTDADGNAGDGGSDAPLPDACNVAEEPAL